VYGRVLHLEPMKWVDDWPVIGLTGEPVLEYKKPNVKAAPVATPVESDEFSSSKLGLQWQWQANPQSGWALPAPNSGTLRLTCGEQRRIRNLWDAPNLLLQKFPGPTFTATTKLTFTSLNDGERAGLVVFGTDYATIALERRGGELLLTQSVCKGASTGANEKEAYSGAAPNTSLVLRARVLSGGRTEFSMSQDGVAFVAIGEALQAQPGRWVGGKIGLFAERGAQQGREVGYADVDWFRVE
jgi:beta-xylosidase